MAVHSFIAGTPLHVMISLSLIRQLGLTSTAKLKIVDYFAGAWDVYRRMKGLEWQYSDIDVSLFPSHRRAYLDCVMDGTNHLYLDSDASFQRYLDLIAIKVSRPRLKVIIFEDGVGSYRSDIYRGLKKRTFNTIGVGTHLGGSPFTENIFVFERDRYRSVFPDVKAKVNEIEESLSGTIKRLKPDLDYIFGYEPNVAHHENCDVYLSSWKVDNAFVKSLAKNKGDTFIKLHPHIKRYDLELGVKLLNGKVPAEIILLDLADRYKSVDVYHHGSSVEQYVTHENVRFINL